LEAWVETPRFQVNTFPSDDEELARFVAELVSAVSDASDSVVAWLESALRERYPQAAVAERSELADMFPTEPLTMYVYRDGSPLPAPRD
jgi:hypothetical protein